MVRSGSVATENPEAPGPHAAAGLREVVQSFHEISAAIAMRTAENHGVGEKGNELAAESTGTAGDENSHASYDRTAIRNVTASADSTR